MLRASVVDTAQLPTLGGPTPVWVVEMDFAGLSSTMWIDQRNRALVQQTIRLAPEISILMTRPELAASPANQP